MNAKKVEEILSKYKNGQTIKRKETIFYQGIIGLRKSGIKYFMTEFELEEYSKCYNDELYFIEKYLGAPNGGKHKLYDFQEKIIDHFKENRFQIFLTSKQTGSERILMMLLLHSIVFKKKVILMFDGKNINNIENLNTLKEYYYKLPFFIQKGVKKWDIKNIVLENGSSLKISSPLSNGVVEIDILLLNNYSSYGDLTFHNSIFPLITLKNDSKLIIKSSLNGNNLFYKLLQDSERPEGDPEKNNYKTYRVYWWQVPGRDNNWKNNMIAEVGQDLFNSDYDFKFNGKF